MRNLIQRTMQKTIGYYADARQRAQRRKSNWNLILIPLGGAAVIGVWYTLFRLVWLFHVAMYPDHQLQDFWQKGIGFGSFVSSFLMVFAPAPAALTVGFMVGNLFAWLFSPARRVFQAEASDYPNTNFRATMRALSKASVWTVVLGLLIALTASVFLKSLR